MSTTRYQRRSPDQWRALIEHQLASGLSQREFCDQQGLSKSSFRLWKQHLGMTAQQASPAKNSVDNTTLFAPLVADTSTEREEAPDETDSAGWEIELDLGDGVCLRFRRGGR